MRAADRLLAVSEFTRSRMASTLGVDRNRIAILPDTFDPEEFYPQRKPHFLVKRYGLVADQPVILTIARLASAERYKGYDQLLRALPLVREQFPNVRYVLGGRGPDRPRVEALIRKLNVAANVTLAGYVTSSFSKYGPKLFGIPLPQWGWEDAALRGNFAAVHRLAALVFAVLIVIHVAAALKHLLVDKDSVFQRMLPG